MITQAAVKIYDKKQETEVIIPCYRHCDAFLILKLFGYCKGTDYIELDQGFLDEHDKFYNRTDAWRIAWREGQISANLPPDGELFSEDLY